MAGFEDSDLTNDRFLGGRLIIAQPRKGYRAGADPVFLAAAVPAKSGQAVLELGCGAGVAALCLARRVSGLRLAGIELQPDYAALARQNAAANGLELEVVSADLRDPPRELANRSFDHVLANPPYFRPGAVIAADQAREVARSGDTPLADWIAAARRRLLPKGYLTMVQRADRLDELLYGVRTSFGSVVILPLSPRSGRAADLVIVQARKGGRAGLRLLSPLVLHRGDTHLKDGESYTAAAQAILRDGSQLPLVG